MSKMKQYIDLMTPLKAYEKGREDAGYDEYKRGIREVVEWLLSEGGFPWEMDEYPNRIKPWQAKLKEWGIKND